MTDARARAVQLPTWLGEARSNGLGILTTGVHGSMLEVSTEAVSPCSSQSALGVWELSQPADDTAANPKLFAGNPPHTQSTQAFDRSKAPKVFSPRISNMKYTVLA